MVLCLGDLLGGFCDIGCHLLLLMFFIVLLFFYCFSASSLTLLWTIAGIFTPHFILWAQYIAKWFVTLLFAQPFCSCHERYSLEWAFFTHRRLLPYPLSQHFWHNLLLSRSAWEPTVLPWSLQGFILIFKTQTRPICLFDSQ